MDLFSDIIGHQDVTKALTAVLANRRVGHAYLFLGPAGIGKKTLAREFARALLCQGTKRLDCDCPSCSRLESGNHPDYVTIEASGNSIKIEQLRELQHGAYYRPLLGDWKIYFFPEAEQLTEAAANSFLKLLEEPPAGIVFLFTAVRVDYILPTIRSRCQVYHLFPVAAAAICEWLVAKGYANAEARSRSQACEGIPGRALQAGPEAQDQKTHRAMSLLEQNLLELLKTANEFEKWDRKEVVAVLRNWQVELRAELLKAQAAGHPPGDGKTQLLVVLIERLVETIRMVEANVNQRLALENFLIGMRQMVMQNKL